MPLYLIRSENFWKSFWYQHRFPEVWIWCVGGLEWRSSRLLIFYIHCRSTISQFIIIRNPPVIMKINTDNIIQQSTIIISKTRFHRAIFQLYRSWSDYYLHIDLITIVNCWMLSDFAFAYYSLMTMFRGKNNILL